MIAQTTAELMGNVKLEGSDHEMVVFQDPSGEWILASSGIWLVEYHRIKLWREKDQRKLINIQGSPPPV